MHPILLCANAQLTTITLTGVAPTRLRLWRRPQHCNPHQCHFRSSVCRPKLDTFDSIDARVVERGNTHINDIVPGFEVSHVYRNIASIAVAFAKIVLVAANFETVLKVSFSQLYTRLRALQF